MASSLGKFTAALMAASQENTMALAALNFDFSLYKVEAPKEYQLLGNSLSEDRRRQAETGSQHIAARKLGAIFRSRLPKVPHLLQAFGHRVSEIAAASKKMKKETKSSSAESHDNHIFSKNVGIDGTSLWAAATSGPEALCVQLLACILARIWSPPQAISIWAEILDVRTAELRREGMDIADIAALNSTVTREQLAELDASTRSWLQTADALKATELIQLRLIIGNIDAPVNNTPGTYDSVMEAWTVSMQVADNLIAGVAQSVYNGAALLGLSAWHLYPDMSVYSSGLSSGPPEREVRQGDPLFNPGGILTIGLRPSDDFNYGVRWSLPLAKLRYYGAPTTITRTIGADPSRVSITELMLAALGALSREWPETKDKYKRICKFYQLLASRMKVPTDSVVAGYKALGKAAEDFLHALPDRRNTMTRIMAYGSRNGGEFLKDEEGKAPTYETQTLGMTKASELIKFVSDCSMRQNILWGVLRESASKSRLHFGNWIVVSFEGDSFSGRTGRPHTDLQQDSTTGAKPISDYFHRWISREGTTGHSLHFVDDAAGHTEFHPDAWTWAKKNDDAHPHNIARRTANNVRSKYPTLTFTHVKEAWNRSDAFEHTLFAQSFCPKSSSTGLSATHLEFKHFFGDPKYAAIYKKVDIPTYSEKGFTMHPEVKVDDILAMMQKDFLDFKGISTRPNAISIPLLGLIDRLYVDLDSSESTISLDVLRTPLSSKKCFSGFESESAKTRTAVAFSTVAYLETGDQDLDPVLLNNVMAVAVGSSIYAAGALSSDPHEDPDSCSLSRTFGNIGKPGVSLLIPPPDPQIKKNDTGEWNVINHEPWDGIAADHFSKTSLHLSLTEYRVPYTSQHQGQRDMQAFFQEAIVSVYDGNAWVGDIDIVKALSSTSTLAKVPIECENRHMYDIQTMAIGGTQEKKGKKRNAIIKQIVCADTWQELLDKANRPMVLRCHDNWVGRLAVTSISVQLGYRTLVLPRQNCKNGCFKDPNFTSKNIVGHTDVIIF